MAKLNNTLLAISIVLALVITMGIGYTTRVTNNRSCMLPPELIAGWTTDEIMISVQAWHPDFPEDTYVEGRCMDSQDVLTIMEYMKAVSGCWQGE